MVSIPVLVQIPELGNATLPLNNTADYVIVGQGGVGKKVTVENFIGGADFATLGSNTFTGVQSLLYEGAALETAYDVSIGRTIKATTNRPVSGSGGFPYLSTNSFLFEQTYVYGTVTGATIPLNLLAGSDAVQLTTSNGRVDYLRLEWAAGSGIQGNRAGVYSNVELTGVSNNSSGTYLWSGVFNAFASSSDGGGAANEARKGSLQAINGQARLYNSAQNFAILTAAEFNTTIETGSSSAYKVGALIAQLTTDTVHGTFSDSGLVIANQGVGTGNGGAGWGNVISIGSEWSSWPGTSTCTLFKAQRNMLTQNFVNNMTAAYGISLQDVTFSQAAWVSTNAFISGAGKIYGNGLQTVGAISAVTASLSSVTVTDGGVYATKPTLTVDAPPSGSTATATVATMGLSLRSGYGVTAVVAGGTGYLVGDILTVAGGTGTAPTIQVDAVNGSGAITAASVKTAGSMSVLPSNPASVTGGAGGSATFTLSWTILTVTVSGAGSGYPEKPVPRILAGQIDYIAATLTAVMSTANAALVLTSANLSSTANSLTVTGTSTAEYFLSGAAGYNRGIEIKSVNQSRWFFGANSTAESGADAGSDFIINRIHDSGFGGINVLTIARSTGVSKFAAAVQGASFGQGASGPTWTSGTGAPVSTEVKGSYYSRTDGGLGTTLYVSQGGGTWNAVAGV